MATHCLLLPILLAVSKALAPDTCGQDLLNLKNRKLNSRLIKYVLYQYSAPTIHSCYRECMFMTACKSINYDFTRKICEINTKSEEETEASDFINAKGVVFKDVSERLESLVGGCVDHKCKPFQRCWPLGKDHACLDYFEPIIGITCREETGCWEMNSTCFEEKCFCGSFHSYDKKTGHCVRHNARCRSVQCTEKEICYQGQCVCAVPFSGQKCSECSQNFTDGSGIVTSPYYPFHYLNSLDCNFFIVVAKGSRVEINFLDAELEGKCYYDTIQVFDYACSGTESELLSECAGLPYKTTYQSTCNVLRIRLRTDCCETHRGFLLEYRTVA